MKEGRQREEQRWEDARHGCSIRTESGHIVRGKAVWVSEYTVGFLPTGENSRLDELGMEDGVECVLFKSFVRVMTPEKQSKNTPKRTGHGRRTQGRRDPVVQRL